MGIDEYFLTVILHMTLEDKTKKDTDSKMSTLLNPALWTAMVSSIFYTTNSSIAPAIYDLIPQMIVNILTSFLFEFIYLV